ncbi:MAG: phosphodiester glycosidase family protein [Niameybacter sp.]|uniref:phosphodiester glycosidase family protein n=1 Tax=Niameybacter sp. TaxID=2033640 RepID=UPI002FCA40D6
MKKHWLYKTLFILALLLLCTLGLIGLVHRCKDATYVSDTLNIQLEHIEDKAQQMEYWIATVQVQDMQQVQAAFANDTFPGKDKQFVSTIARQHDAILAINGAATGFNDVGIVIRNGIIYRDEVFDCAPLEMRQDGTLFIGEYGKRTASQMLEDGTVHTWDFSPDLIVDGKVANYAAQPWFSTDRAPRTLIGQRTPYEYIIIVADGRRPNCPGMTYQEAVDIYQALGCTWAYALDGGGSTTLYFKGKVVNHPSRFIQRPYSDILYFVE